MSDLKYAIGKIINDVWNDRGNGVPSLRDNLAAPWSDLGIGSRKHVVNIAARLIDQLIEDGSLALPDQPDEWQECTFDEIRKGDLVKRVMVKGSSTRTIEGYAYDVSNNYWLDIDDNILASGYDTPEDGYWLYRKPKRVVHPDPDEHLLILVTTTVYTEYNPPAAHVWDGNAYIGINDFSYLMPDSITDWTPAKAVPHDL